MTIKGFDHLAITVSDVAASLKFYEGVMEIGRAHV